MMSMTMGSDEVLMTERIWAASGANANLVARSWTTKFRVRRYDFGPQARWPVLKGPEPSTHDFIAGSSGPGFGF